MSRRYQCAECAECVNLDGASRAECVALARGFHRWFMRFSAMGGAYAEHGAKLGHERNRWLCLARQAR